MVMLAVALIAFTLFRFVGDPGQPDGRDRDQPRKRAALREQLGLNDPDPVQFVPLRRRRRAVQFRQFVPVQDAGDRPDRRALSRRRWSLRSAPPRCSRCCRHPDGRLYGAAPRSLARQHLFQAVSLVGISLPTFLIGILLIFLFPVTLGWLPSFGRGDVVRPRLLDHRPAHRVRAQGADHARDHARPVPDDADHAAGARAR